MNSAYSTLNGTYSCGAGCGAQAPMNVGVPSMSTQTVLAVPQFGAGFGYDALSHGGGVINASGYFDLKKAYPTNCPPLAARQCTTIGPQTYANLQ